MTVAVAYFRAGEEAEDECCRSSSWKPKHRHPRTRPTEYRKPLLNQRQISDHLKLNVSSVSNHPTPQRGHKGERKRTSSGETTTSQETRSNSIPRVLLLSPPLNGTIKC